jgi:hypothetical protein
MHQTTFLLGVQIPTDHVILLIRQLLTSIGLTVCQSFDLQTARAAHKDCACPHHGTDMCDCQMAVLLVYEENGEPLTLVAHGQNGYTSLEIFNPPYQRPSGTLQAAVKSTLQAEKLLEAAYPIVSAE